MRVNLRGVFNNCVGARAKDRGHYQFALDEFYQHLVETVEGKHTLDELAYVYCLKTEAAAVAKGIG